MYGICIIIINVYLVLSIYENLSFRLQALFLTLAYRLQRSSHHDENADKDRRRNDYSQLHTSKTHQTSPGNMAIAYRNSPLSKLSVYWMLARWGSSPANKEVDSEFPGYALGWALQLARCNGYLFGLGDNEPIFVGNPTIKPLRIEPSFFNSCTGEVTIDSIGRKNTPEVSSTARCMISAGLTNWSIGIVSPACRLVKNRLINKDKPICGPG